MVQNALVSKVSKRRSRGGGSRFPILLPISRCLPWSDLRVVGLVVA
jgi:hypothetical protein